MQSRLRDRNFAAMLEALIEYAAAGSGYSFVSSDGDGKLTITISVDDQAAYTAKQICAMEQMGLDERPRVTLNF